MLEGKFRDRTHLGCGYSLWTVQPTNIVWLETGYFARCPRCLVYLPVDVDPDSIPKLKPRRRKVSESEAEVPMEPTSEQEAEVEPAPEVSTEVEPEE